ncbi:MAG TPA: acylphosphatase [Terriglobia bacterium]|nr:acylphosphatase [Terriglobia bacterium]
MTREGARQEIAKKFLVFGRVQGVGYRFFAQREAAALGIRGYARNLSDGNVEVCAAGSEKALEEFERRLQEGPLGAEVTRVEETGQLIDKKYARFVIEG